jgi:hypothetical protein
MTRKDKIGRFLIVFAVLMVSSTAMADLAVRIDAETSDGQWPVNLPFSLGYTFTVDTEIIVTELGRFDVNGGGLDTDSQARLYNWDTGQALTGVMITPFSRMEATGIFNSCFETIDPLVLVPGTSYLLATEVEAGDFYFDQSKLVATFPVGINHLAGKATPVGNSAMPESADASTFTISNDNDTYYGPNFKFIRQPAVPGIQIEQETSDGAWPVNFPFSLGYTFTVESEMTVTQLGRFDVNGAGLDTDSLARLYNWDTGEAVTQATITPSSPFEATGVFNSHFEAIDPVILEPGITYLLAVEVGSGDFYFDQTQPVAAFPAGITHWVGKATPVGSPAMPEVADVSTFTISNDQDSYYGPNFKFVRRPATAVRIDRETADGAWPVNFPFSLGYTFTVNSRTLVTHLGRFDIDGGGLAHDALVRLYNWDTGDTVLGTTIRPSSSFEAAGLFDCYFESVDPVILEPDITYLIAVEVGSGDFYFDQTASVATFANGFIHGVGKATPVGNPAMPERADTSTFTISNDQDTYYGPNLKILPAPPDELPPELDTHVAVDIVDVFKSRRPPADDVELGFAGYVFSVESEIMVTHLGSFDIKRDGLEEDVQVRVLDWHTGDVLAHGTIAVPGAAETTGLFKSHFTEIDPVTLNAGMTYAIVMDVTQIRDYTVHPSDQITSWASGLNYHHGIRTEPDAQSMPSNPNDFIRSDHRDAYFGPNFKFSYKPETFTLDQPLTRAVFQRNAQNSADVPVTGVVLDKTQVDEVQFRSFLSSEGTTDNPWQSLPVDELGAFSGHQVMPAGVWHSVQVRALKQGQVISQRQVNQVGVGEVFITAGQSNSANYGAPALTPQDDRISAWTGSAWRHAADPQPIATGTGGSPWSRLGDLLAADLDIPVGFISVGVGATRVDQWVPGAQYYSRIASAIEATKPTGFRALLWHQGESDSLVLTSPETYAARLKSIIDQTREDAGWDIPWGVAIVGFHPQSAEPAEADVRKGQQMVIDTVGNVFPGPNTDLLGSTYRSDTVHFNSQGLAEHGKGWLEAIYAWFPDLP